MSNYNGFAKTKAGWHFLFFAQTCRKLIKRTNVALAHNGWWYVVGFYLRIKRTEL